MPRRLKLRDASGFVTISSQGGQIQTSDASGVTKPISSQGQGFTAYGDVFQGELVYLNTDGTVSIPGSISDDPNKADNIIGVFLSDADDGEEVQIVTKGSVTLSSLNLQPRTIYYIDARGRLTTTTTPYIFGKSLSSNSIMVDISFMQSILNIYGITPTFDKLVSNWSAKDLSVNISWSSEDKISRFEIPSIGVTLDYSKDVKSSPFSQSLEDFIGNGITNMTHYIAKITNEKNVSTEFSFQVLGGIDDNSKIEYEYSGLGGQYLEGSGLFLDTNIFAKTKIELFLYTNNEWSFGENNNLPLRKLFFGSFVNKDERGNYVIVVFEDEQLRLYENEEWDFHKISYIGYDLSFSSVDTYKQVESSLSNTIWNGSMIFYSNDKSLVKGSILYYKTKKEEYVKLPAFEATFFDNKYFYQFSKGVVMSSEINFGYDYSKTNQKTIEQINKAFDKFIKTPYQSNGKMTFYTAGSREVGKYVYYSTTLGRIEKVSILGFSFDLFDGESIVSLSEKGIITNIDGTTTTTTTESVSDAMSGYLADDLEYLSFEDGLYLLSESTRPDIDIPDILDPIKPDREVKEELFR